MFDNKSGIERGQIIGLFLSRKSKIEIPNILGYDIKTVRLWTNRYAEEGLRGLRDRRSNNARPFALSAEEEQGLVDFSHDHPFKSTKFIKQNLQLHIT